MTKRDEKKNEEHINNILNKYLNSNEEEPKTHKRGFSKINLNINKLRKPSNCGYEYPELQIQDHNITKNEEENDPIENCRKKLIGRRKSQIKCENDLPPKSRKASKRRESIVKDLVEQNNPIGNILENELFLEINSLKEELKNEKIDKENLIKKNKDILAEKNKEIEILNEKLKLLKEVIRKNENDIYETKKNYSSNYNSQSNSKIVDAKSNNSEAVNVLKQENLDLFTENEILKVKSDELEKTNLDLNNLIDNLSTQLNTYKAKYSTEVNELLDKVSLVEKEKINLEIKIKEYNQNMQDIIKKESNSFNFSTNSHFNSSFNSSNEKEFSNNPGGNKIKSILASLKNEIKTLQKKNEDEKKVFDNTINIINEELKVKDQKIIELTQSLKKLEIENNSLIEKSDNIEKDYFININQTKDFKNFGEHALITGEKLKELNTIKFDLETRLHHTKQELIITKSEYETFKQTIERHKKMELALKNEMQLKEQELGKRTELIKQIQIELSKLNDENLIFKKENLNLKSKLELTENEVVSKYEYEINGKNHDIFMLNEKISNFQKSVENFKEKLVKKENIIKLKKQAYITLVEIIKSKRNEVKCLEAMQFMNSAGMKENIKKIRDSENELLEQLEDYSNNPDFTESDEEIYSEDDDKNQSFGSSIGD